MVLIVCLIIMGSIAGGFLMWKKSKWGAWLLWSPTLLIFIGGGAFFYFMTYDPKPEALTFSTHQQHHRYVVEAKWHKPLDMYRFSTDFIVFYVKGNQKVTAVSRKRVTDYQHMDMPGLYKTVGEYMASKGHTKNTPQVFDIKTTKEMNFSFRLPDGVKKSDVHVYYIHTREEPMDSLTFWAKEIDLSY